METMITLITIANQDRQQVFSTSDAVVVELAEPSVVFLQEPISDAMRYERMDNDLLVHDDSRTIQLSQFFAQDSVGNLGELVVGEAGQGTSLVTFDDLSEAPAPGEAVELVSQVAPLSQDDTVTVRDTEVNLEASEPPAPSDGSDDAANEPSVVITAPLSDDDVISAAEYGQSLPISGTSTGLEEGDVVTVNIGGFEYPAGVQADGSWSVVVLPEVMEQLPAGSATTITATAETASGEVVEDSHSIFVIFGSVQVTIDPIGTDGLLNATEITSPLTVTGSATNAPNGGTVVLALLDRQFTGQIDENGDWSVELPTSLWDRLADGDIHVTATVTNAEGNIGQTDTNIELDTVVPTVTINELAEDNIVNAVEHGRALEVTGSTTGLEGGEVITVELNGESYTTVVNAAGNWSVVVRASDVEALADGENTLNASVTTDAGNTGTGSHTFNVDTFTPTLTINTPVAGDDIINRLELGLPLEISGTTTGQNEGDVVTIGFNDRVFTTFVEADGSWYIGIYSSEIGDLSDGLHIISASVENAVGNRAEESHAVIVDSTVKVIDVDIDTIAGDDSVNAAEAVADMTITGMAKGADAGDVVILDIGGSKYYARVAEDGSWSADVPASAWSSIADGTVEVAASITTDNSAGSATREVILDTVPPTLTINTISEDDVVNAIEHGRALEIGGTAEGLVGGEVVSVVVNGKTYTTAVTEEGTWELNVGAKDVMALSDGDYTVTASVSDAAGNEGNAEHDFTVVAGGDSLPTLTITSPVAGDDVISSDEREDDLSISGTSTGLAEGSEVVVNVNDDSYTATVAADGSWNIVVPADVVSAMENGVTVIEASAEDSVGNRAEDTHYVVVQPIVKDITLDPIAEDNIVNADESNQDMTITGTVTHATEGDAVTVTIGDTEYAGVVAADGSWSVDVPAGAWAGIAEGTVPVVVSLDDGTQLNQDVLLDTVAPEVTIDAIAADDIINAGEHGDDLTVTGSATGLTGGEQVNVNINGKDYTATAAADGSWKLDVPAEDVAALADGDYTVTATVSDAAGNEGSDQRDFSVVADADSLPTVSIDTIAGDDIVNATEHEQALTVSGTATKLAAGDKVEVELNGKSYTSDVAADGSWSVDVAAADVAALADGNYTVVATGTDAAGNQGTDQRDFSVVANAAGSLPTVSIDTIAGDDIVNASEHEQVLSVSGTTTNVAEGDTVSVELNGQTYEATAAADGSWSVEVAAADVTALADGDYTVTATVTDAAGNQGTDQRDFSVVASADSLPTISIDTIAGDDIVNATEHEQALGVSGTTTGLAGGEVVTVSLNGNDYTTTVKADGSWELYVGAKDVTVLEDGDYTVTASVTDAVGNQGTDQRDFSVVASAENLPKVTIDTIAGDDIVNASEHEQAMTITGTTSKLEAGDKVNIELNGKSYTADVAADGTWSVDVAAADVTALADGDYTVTATATDAAGNDCVAQRDFSVAAGAGSLPTVSIDSIAGDDIVNASEHDQALTVSGTSTKLAAGDKVDIELNGKSYTADVAADGSWSVDVDAADVAALADGDYTVTATATDAAGNQGTDQRDFSVAADAGSLPTVSIDTIAGDDIVNAAEHDQALTVSGTSTKLAAGDKVEVELNGQTYEATAAADGSWSLDVPAADVTALADGDYTVTATATDAAGNQGTDQRDFSVAADAGSLPTVSIDTIAGDDIVNAAEHDQALTVSGTSTKLEAGDKVEVELNGQTYEATAAADGSWSLDVPAADVTALADGDYTVTATATDAAGNQGTDQRDFSVAADAGSLPTLAITGPLAGDDIINAAEHEQALTVSGTSTNLEAGDKVNVELNGKSYTADVAGDGSWSVDVAAADVTALADGDYTVTATATDAAGNTADTNHQVSVATADVPVVINPVTGDDIINAAEAAEDVPIDGTAPAGSDVVVTVDGKEYPTTADEDGNWAVEVPADVWDGLEDGTATIDVDVTDPAGNTGEESRDVTLDTTPPVVTIDSLAGDDIINASEHDQPLTVSGKAEGAAAGDKVNVELNGNAYEATVAEDGSWSVDVPATDVAALADGDYPVIATVTDAAGNEGSVQRDLSVAADAANLPTVSIDTIAGDDIVNASEHEQALTVSGTSTKLAAGDKVDIELNGSSYTADVAADGTWSVDVAAADVAALADGDYTVTATATDAAGNQGTDQRDFSVAADAGSLPTVSIDTISGDDMVNASEHDQPLTVSGTVTKLVAGDTVEVELNGNAYKATVAADGTWSVDVAAADVTALADGDYTVMASATDAAGNTGTAQRDFSVVASAENLPDVTIDTIAGDDIINAAEHEQALTVSGTSTNLEAGDKVNVELNGNTYEATVAADGSWSVDVAAADVTALADGDYTVTATVTDAAGNTDTAQRDFSVAASADSLPTLAITGPLAGDDIINASEHEQALTVSGTSTNLEAGDKVNVELNGNAYEATVAADGSWSVDVAAADVTALADGDYTVTAKATDAAGNTADANRQVSVATADAAVKVNPVTGDDIINADEAAKDVPITGEAPAGSDVVVTVDGKDYPTTADGNGNWAVDVPADVWAGLEDGTATIDVNATDPAGNTGNASHDVALDTTPPALSIDTIAGDDIINASEHDQPLTVSGKADGVPAGGKVNVDLNGNAYEATVADDGSWSVVVPAADVATLEDGEFAVTATATDAAGNEGTVQRDFSVTASADSLPTLAIDTLAGDDIVNASEHDQALTVSGTSTNLTQGDKVEVELNGKAYTATVAADGTWSVDVASADVAALADGDYTVKATATDAAGNEATAQHDFSVAASVPTVTIVGPVAGDDIISAVEHDQALAVDGTVTGIAPGSIVRVEIVGVPNSTYLGLVKEDGSFRIGIAGEYVSMLQDGKAQVRAWATNDLGNTGEGFYEFDVVTGSLPVTIDAVAGDDVVDSTEAVSTLTVTGSVINAAAGDEVVMKVGGDTYTGVVNEDGTTWSVDIDPVTWSHFKDTDIDVNVTVTNAQGNSGSAVRTVGLDISTPVIYFDTIAEDDIVNASEHAQDLQIGGSVLGLDGGETMNIELNGKTYTTTATADGRWTLNVPAADVSALADGNHTVSASVTEEAGNTGTASHDFSVDTVLPTLTVTEGVTRSGDNIVTPDEHGTNLEVFGTSTGLDHDFVYLEIAGFTYNIQTFDDGTWGIVTRRADMATLTDGTYEIKLHATNDVGNVAETSVELVVDAGVPALQLLSTEAQDSAVVDDQAVAGSVEDDTQESTQADEHFTIGNGGHDSVVYHLLDAADATGGNGADRISGFTVGDGNNTADADRIDLSELLAERRPTEGNDGAETTETGDLSDYLSVTVKGSDTEIAIDRDGAGSAHEMTTIVTLSGVQTDLATLLANHQLIVS